MPYSEQLARRIRDRLTSMRASFEEKKMFGGIACMIRDKMCIGIIGDDLMVRVLDENYENLLNKTHAKTMDFTGRVLKGFIIVQAEGIQTEEQLDYWLKAGLEFGEKGIVKTKKPAKKRRPGTK